MKEDVKLKKRVREAKKAFRDFVESHGLEKVEIGLSCREYSRGSGNFTMSVDLTKNTSRPRYDRGDLLELYVELLVVLMEARGVCDMEGQQAFLSYNKRGKREFLLTRCVPVIFYQEKDALV